jgi:hypothetical protein
MFWEKSDVAELRKQNEALRQQLDDASESTGNLQQAVANARYESERMKRAYTEEGLNEIALITARRIEDLFVSCPGGRDHRLKMVQAILREVMRANLSGSTYWKGPGEPSYSPPTTLSSADS